eukprot:1937686-Prymnesium_polylepis.1
MRPRGEVQIKTRPFQNRHMAPSAMLSALLQKIEHLQSEFEGALALSASVNLDDTGAQPDDESQQLVEAAALLNEALGLVKDSSARLGRRSAAVPARGSNDTLPVALPSEPAPVMLSL